MSASILIGVFSFFPSQADLRAGPDAPRWERPIIWVHDEALLEVPEADAEEAAALLQKAMIEAFLENFPRAPTEGLVKATIGQSGAVVRGRMPNGLASRSSRPSAHLRRATQLTRTRSRTRNLVRGRSGSFSDDLYQVAAVLAGGTDQGTRMARLLNEAFLRFRDRLGLAQPSERQSRWG